MRRHAALIVLIFGALAAWLLVPSSATAATGGAITQLADPAGCVVNGTATAGCSGANGLARPGGVAMDGDGKNLYVTGDEHAWNSFAVFSRDTTQDGKLTQVECWNWNASAGCKSAPEMREPTAAAVSPDNENVYVVSNDYGGVHVFSRALDTGALTRVTGPTGCLTDASWFSATSCADVRNVSEATDVEVSPDGKHVYVISHRSYSSTNSGVAVFDRDPDTGALTQREDQAACVSDNGNSGACVDGRALAGARDIELSSDGRFAYVSAQGSDALTTFWRDPETGFLTQLEDEAGCVRLANRSERCATAVGGSGGDSTLWGPYDFAIAPDGEDLYVAVWDGHSIGRFQRDGATGELSQTGTRSDCVKRFNHHGGLCRESYGTVYPSAITVAPDGETVYVGTHWDDSVTALRRDADGDLNRLPGTLGCVSERSALHDNATNGVCQDGHHLNQSLGQNLIVSPDGTNVYLGAIESNAVATFRREPGRQRSTPARLEWDFGLDFRSATGDQENPSRDSAGTPNVWRYGYSAAGGDGTARAPGERDADGNYPGYPLAASWVEFSRDSRAWRAGTTEPWVGSRNANAGRVHPGASRSAVVGWRNPVAGTTSFEVTGMVHDADPNGGDGVKWYLDKSSPTGACSASPLPAECTLRSGTLDDGGRATGFELTGVSLAQDDQLWLVISPRANHNNDNTRVDLHVTGPLESAVQTTVSGPRGLTRDDDPKFAFDANVSPATFECRIDGGDWGACGADAGQDPKTKTYTDLADGAHTFEVKAKDTATTVEDPSPAKRTITVDTTPPDTEIVNGPSGLTRDASPDFSFEGSPSAETYGFECALTPAGGEAVFARCDSARQYSDLDAGEYTFQVRALDRAGNRDQTPASRTFDLQADPPATQPGALRQLQGKLGCWSETGSGGACEDGIQMNGPAATAVSPLEDGQHKHVYAVNYHAHSVTLYDRAVDGSLTQRIDEADTGCVGEYGNGQCRDARALTYAWDIVMSKDGEHVYVAGHDSDAIAHFVRDKATGVLTQAADETGCIRQGGGASCATGRGLDGPTGLDLSPDGKQLYVSSYYSDAVAVVDLDATTGAPTQPADASACWSETGTGGCGVSRVLNDARDVVVSKDGENVYAIGRNPSGASNGGIAVFKRDGATGDLTAFGGEQGCHANDTTDGNCRRSYYLAEPESIAVSPDDRNVYVAGNDGLAVFDRDAEQGTLAQPSGRGACVTDHDSQSCMRGIGMRFLAGLAVSPDGRNVYTATHHSSWGNTLHVMRRDADGHLRMLTGRDRCWSSDGEGGSCGNGRALNISDNHGLTVTPDGKSVYLASLDEDALAAFKRAVPADQGQPALMEWDATADFEEASPGANPGGDAYGNSDVWQYRRAPALGHGLSGRDPSVYTAAENRLDSFSANGRHGVWRTGWFGSTSSDYHGIGPSYDDRFVMHPDHDGNDGDGDGAALGWKSPLPDGTKVTVEALVERRYHWSSAGDGVRWFIDKGTDPLASGTMRYGDRYQQVEREVTVDNGETLWFVVAPRQTWDYDSTFFDVHVTGPAVSGPQTSITTRAPHGLTGDNTPSFRLASSAAGATFECRAYAKGAETVPAFSACPAADAETALRTLDQQPDGEHVFEARALDGATPDPSPARREFKVDTAAPTTSISSGPSGTTRLTSPTYAFASSEENSVLECRLDEAKGGQFQVCTSPHKLPELAEGEHTFDVRARDRAHNQGAHVRRTINVVTGAGASPVGALAQLPGAAGCVSQTATWGDGSTCTQGRYTDEVNNGAITPDGKYVLAAAYTSRAITSYSRDATTGALTPVAGEGGCIASSGAANSCKTGRGLHRAFDVAVTPAGAPGPRNVYVAAHDSHAVATLELDADGNLAQPAGTKGCISEDGGEGCADGNALVSPRSVAVSPDGLQVYVAAGNSVVTLDRDPVDGSLSQAPAAESCITSSNSPHGGCARRSHLDTTIDVAVTPDGKNVYTTAHHSQAVVAFGRESDGDLVNLPGAAGCIRDEGHSADGCARAGHIYYPRGLAMDPKGEFFYVASRETDAISVLRREPDGGLSQGGNPERCIEDNPGGCAEGTGMNNLSGLEVAPDGQHLYAASQYDSTVTAFSIDAGDGSLRQLPGADACWSDNGNVDYGPGQSRAGRCRDGKRLDFNDPHEMLISPDNKHVYGFAGGHDSIVAFERRRPEAATQPQRLVWNAQEDFRAADSAAKTSPDRYGNENVWHYRKALVNGTGSDRAPEADGAGYPVLPVYRHLGHQDTRGWFDGDGEDYPWMALAHSLERRVTTHPLPGEAGVLGWKNPYGDPMNVDLSALFQDGDHNGGSSSDGVVWWVDNGTTPLEGGTLASAARGQAYDGSVTVPGGGFLWFGVAMNGNASNDTAVIDATITGTLDPSPQTTITKGPRTVTTTGAPVFEYGASATGATFKCRIDDATEWTACPGAEALAADADAGLPAREKATLALADGAHTLRVQATSDGGTDQTPAVRRFTVDTTPPNTEIESGPEGATRDRTPVFRFTTPRAAGEENELRHFECRMTKDGDAAADWARCDSSYTGRDLTDGTWTFEVRASDRAGNVDLSPAGRVVVVDTQPGKLQFGALTQLPAAKGCVNDTGLLGDLACVDGKGHDGTSSVAVVGNHVYTTGWHADSVTGYTRAADGSLTPLEVPDGQFACANATGADGCLDTHGIDGPEAIAASPDGKQLYVTSYNAHSVAIIDRDPATGALTQDATTAGCLSEYGGDTCLDTVAMYLPTSVTVAPDGKNVYVASRTNHTVATFVRDTTDGGTAGDLTVPSGQDKCAYHYSSSDCRTIQPLHSASAVAVVGEDVYVANYHSHSVVQLKRNATNGGLTRASDTDSACLRRDGTWEACRAGRGLAYAIDIVASPDGKNLYVANDYYDSGIAVLDRNPETGVLTQDLATPEGCWSQHGNGENDSCHSSRALAHPTAIEIAPDGRTLYAADRESESLVAFRRTVEGPGTGNLRMLSGAEGCWSESGTNGFCRDGKALGHSYGDNAIAVSPDNAHVYSASRDSDALAVFARRVPRRIDLPAVPEWNLEEDWNAHFDAVGASNVNPIPDRNGTTGVWELMNGNGSADGTGINPATFTAMTGPNANGSWRTYWQQSATDANSWVGLTRNRQVRTHPAGGTTAKPPVMRWRNVGTEAREVEVHATIADTDDYPWNGSDGVRWVLFNGTEKIAGDVIPNGTRAQSVERSVTVPANGTIDLLVTSRNGNHNNDTTDVDFQVTGVATKDTGIAPTEPDTNDDTPSFRLTSTEDAAAFECRVTPPADAAWETCAGSPDSHTVGPLEDGTYVFEARYKIGTDVDPTPATRTIRIDQGLPALTVAQGVAAGKTHVYTAEAPVAEFRGTQPTFSGVAGGEDGSDPAKSQDSTDVKVHIEGTSKAGSAVTRDLTVQRSGTAWTATVSPALPEGGYTVEVTQADDAGNTGRSLARSFKIDQTAPSVAFTKPTPKQAINDGTPTLEGTAGAVDGTGSESKDAGTVTVEITEGDAFGSTVIREFQGTVAADGTFTATPANTDSSTTLDDPLPEGTFTARVRQSDGAGNVGATNDNNTAGADDVTFKVDLTAPVINMDTTAGDTKDRTPSYSGNAGQNSGTDLASSRDLPTVYVKIYRGKLTQYSELAGATLAHPALQKDREAAGDFTISADTLPAGTYEDLVDGTYTAVAEQLDAAGNVGRSPLRSFRVDATGPVPAVSGPPADTNVQKPVIQGTAGNEDGSAANAVADADVVEVVVRDAANSVAETLSNVAVAADGSFQAPTTVTLAPGRYTVDVAQSDALANSGASKTYGFKVDITEPAPTLDAVADGPDISSKRPSFTGDAGTQDGSAATESKDAATVAVKLYKGAVDESVEATASGTRDAASGEFTATLAEGVELTEGAWNAVAVQGDAAGNEGKADAVAFEVDLTKPALTIAADKPAADVKDATPALGGAAGTEVDGGEDGKSADLAPIDVDVRNADGTVVRDLDTTRDGAAWAVSWTGKDPLPAGRYTVTAKQRDDAGNEQVVTRQFRVDLTPPAPKVSTPAEKHGFSDGNLAFTGTAGDEPGTTSDTQSEDDDLVTLDVYEGDTNTKVAGPVTAAVADGAWTKDLTTTLGAGYYSVTVTQTDAAGHSATSARRHFKLDPNAPTPDVDLPASLADLNTVAPALSGSASTADGLGEDEHTADSDKVTVKVWKVVAADGTLSDTPVQTKADIVRDGSTWSTTLASLKEDDTWTGGTYVARVYQSDNAGHTGESAPVRFRVDTKAPVATLESPADETNQANPITATVKGGTEDGSKLEESADEAKVRVEIFTGRTTDATARIVDETKTTTGAATFDVALPDLAEGTYTVRLTQKDAAGNTSAGSTKEFRVDRTKPVVTVDQPAASTKLATPEISGTAGGQTGADADKSPDQAVEVTLFRKTGTDTREELAGMPITATRTGTTWKLDAPTLTSGTYIAEAVQDDAAGNASLTASRTFKVDRDAPAVAVTSPTDDQVTRDTRPEIAGTAGAETGSGLASVADSATVRVEIHKDGALYDAFDADRTDTSFSGTPTKDLVSGTYTIKARQSDALENTSSDAVRTFRVDADKPVPTISTPVQDAAANDATPTFTGGAGTDVDDADSSADAGTIDVYVWKSGTDTSDITKAVAKKLGVVRHANTGAWSTELDSADALTSGTYVVRALQRDAAGWEGFSTARTFEVDLTDPALSLTVASPAKAPEFTGIAGHEDGSASGESGDGVSVTIRVYKDGTEIAAAGISTLRDATTGAYSTAPGTPLSNGTYTATATQADAAGNETVTAPVTFKVDGTGPAVTLTSPSGEDYRTQDLTPTFSGGAGTQDGTSADHVADEAAVTVELTPKSGGEKKTITATRDGGNWTATPSTNLAEGEWTAVAVQADELDNEGRSTPFTLTIDDTDPIVTITSPAPGVRTKQRKPAIAGTLGALAGDLGAITVVADDGTKEWPMDETVTGTGWTAMPADELPEGAYTVRASQDDKALNTGTATQTLTVDLTAPVPTLGAVASPRNSIPEIRGTRASGVGDGGSLKVVISRVGDASFAPVEYTRSAESWSVTPAAADLPKDGTYRISVQQTDEAGNMDPVTGEFVLDRVAPAPSVLSPSGDLADKRPTLSGAAGDAAGDAASVTVELTKVSNGSTITRTATRSGATWSLPIDVDLQGRYTAVAKQGDVAGNASGASAARSFRVDTIAPTVTLAALPELGNDGTPQFEGVGAGSSGNPDTNDQVADDVQVKVEVFNGGTVDATPDHTFTGDRFDVNKFAITGALGDGTYAARAVQSDALANKGVSEPITFKIDSTKPVVDVDGPAEGAHLRTATPTIEGSRGTQAVTDAASADDETVKVRVYDGQACSGTAAIETATSSGDGWQLSGTTLTEGWHCVEAEQSDAAGNLATSAPRAFRVDLTDPAPRISAPANGARTNVTTPAITVDRGTAEGDLAPVTVKLVQGATTKSFTVPAGETTGNAPALTAGEWTITAEQSDKSGRTGTSTARTLTVDLATPSTPVIKAPADGSQSADSTPVLSGTAASQAGDVDKVDIVLTAADQAKRTYSASVDQAGAWEMTVPVALPDAEWTMMVTRQDEAGNVSPAATVKFVMDAAAPIVSLSQPADGSATSDTTPTLAGKAGSAPTDADAVEVEIRSGGSVVQAHTATRSGDGWSVDATTLAEGTYTAQATQADKASNTGRSALVTFRVDTTKPEVAVTAPADGPDQMPTFTGTAGDAPGDSAAVAVTVVDAADQLVQALSATRAGTAWSIKSTSVLPPGSYRVRAVQTDAAGNTGSGTRTFTITAPPVQDPPTQRPTQDQAPTQDPTPTQQQQQPPQDKTPPQASALKFEKRADLADLVSRTGVDLELVMSEPGIVQGQLLAAATRSTRGLGAVISARKRFVLLSKDTESVTRPGKAKITFKLGKKARNKVRKLRKLKLTVRLTVTDTSGNERVITKRLSLKKKRR